MTFRRLRKNLVPLVVSVEAALTADSARAQPITAGVDPRKQATRDASGLSKALQKSLQDARVALGGNRAKDAIRILEAALRNPEGRYSADALELMGEARQKTGQTAEALAAFEEYLRRYPSGEGQARVVRRLYEVKPDASATRTPRPVRSSAEPPLSPRSQREVHPGFAMSGALSSFFIRDDSYNQTKDISVAPNPFADPDAHRLHQNTFLTTIDLFGTINNDTTKTKIKISGMEEQRLRSGTNLNRAGLSSAYVETAFKETDITVRAGRQTRNTSGVIGRFDGGLASWQISDRFRLNAVGGAPNWSRFDAPFRAGRYFAGASLDILKPVDGLDASIYAIQQNQGRLLDRRAIGGEFRYFKNDISALGMLDYDIHFNRINASVLSGSWTLGDQSVLSGGINYLRIPYLASYNALQGQPFLTLFDMLKLRTQEEVRRFAIDRTPVFESAMVSYSRPLNDHLQLNLDATATHVSGTLPSGGVDGSKPSGREYYFSGQLVGTDVFAGGDLYSLHLRHARLADSNVYFADLNTRYPLTEELQINPRLRVGLREGRATAVRDITILPSMLMDYYIAKNLAIETEIGAKWIDSKDRTGVRSTTNGLFIALGLRSEFSTDGPYICGSLAPCLNAFAVPPRERPWHEALYYGGNADSLSSNTDPAESQTAPSSTLVVQGGLRYWYNQGRNSYDYFADNTTKARVSRVSYSRLAAHSGEIFARADIRNGLLTNVFAKGYIGGGAIGSGKAHFEDFAPGATGLLGKTVSENSGDMRFASVDVGYNIFTNETFRLGAFAGFHTWRETVDAKGCAQIGPGRSCAAPLPLSVKVVSERDRWNSFRVGAVLDVNLTERLKWNSEIALASTSQRALDTHYITAGLFPAKGKGGGFQAETELKYQATDRLTLGMGFRWWHLNSSATDTYGQLLKYRTDRYGIFGEANYRLNFVDPPLQRDKQ